MTMIEWAHVAHSVVRGCSLASAGCDNCYGKVILDHAALAKALKLPRARGGEPRRVFWNHRSDTFHERLTDEEIDWQFGAMAARPDLTFLVLTKRAKRMREYLSGDRAAFVEGRAKRFLREMGRPVPAGKTLVWPLPNVWLGVSVENQATADDRIPELLATAAAKRFVSYEPALGPVDFDPSWCPHGDTQRYGSGDDGVFCEHCGAELAGQGWLDGGKLGPVDWVICGSESGPGARPAPLEWVRSVRDQVLAARQTCGECGGEGWFDGVGQECRACRGCGFHGPALFIKQYDVCPLCDGDGHWDDPDAVCWECGGKGQTGKVRKGNPAIDGRVWAEVPV